MNKWYSIKSMEENFQSYASKFFLVWDLSLTVKEITLNGRPVFTHHLFVYCISPNVQPAMEMGVPKQSKTSGCNVL